MGRYKSDYLALEERWSPRDRFGGYADASLEQKAFDGVAAEWNMRAETKG
jgi:hypothetical protein